MERASHIGERRKPAFLARAAAVGLGIGFLLVALLLSAPLDTDRLESRPHPSRSFEEALARIEAVRVQEGAEIAPACRTRLLHRGRRTERAFVFLHGLTNCPNQFLPLAEAAHGAGHNTLLLRLPGHGHADRMTPALADLSAEELARTADLAVDLGSGLGERVTLVGLSVGGVAAAWAGQRRADLDQAVLLAPNFGIAGVPDALLEPLSHLLRLAPNLFLWWKPEQRETLVGPVHAYPRYATRAIGETLRLGVSVRREAGVRPAAARLLVVTNAADPAVSNATTAAVVREWRRRGSRVGTYEFPANWKLGHDFVDPDQPEARPDLVGPILLQLLRIDG